MLTLKLRLKDRYAKYLRKMANDVNFVWNYTNELAFKHLKRTSKFMSAYDIQKYTGGSSKLLSINAQTLQAVSEEYVIRRRQFKKAKLRWRVSNPKSSKRSLGWIPFKGQTVKVKDGLVKYNGKEYKCWDERGLSKYNIRSGCFAEDSRGRWYVCLVTDTIEKKACGTSSVGIDLGLSTFATFSDGTKITNPKLFKTWEQKLGIAQRARKKARVRAIHAKIKNLRKEMHHQETAKLIKQNAAIFVGDINASSLAKTKMAKSVLDAGWSMFREILRYKCKNAGVIYIDIDEKYTTQICSSCQCISDNSPKGRTDLGIREWTCECGVTHDRDINAAKNIFARGHARLVGGNSHVK